MGGDNIEEGIIPYAINGAAAANDGGHDAFLAPINTPSPPSSHQSSDNNNSITRISDSSGGSPPKEGLLADGGSQQQQQNKQQHGASRRDSKSKAEARAMRKAKRERTKALRVEEGRQELAIAGKQSYSIEETNESGGQQEDDDLDLKAAKAEARAFLAARKAKRERDAILSKSSGAGCEDESERFFGGDRGPSTRNINVSSRDDDKGEDKEASGEKEDKETHLVSGLKSMKMDNVTGGQQQEDMGGDVRFKEAKAEARAKRLASRMGSLSRSIEVPRVIGYEDESARFFGCDPSKRDLNTSDNDGEKGEDRESSSVKGEKETHLVSGLKATKGNNDTGGQQQRNEPVLVKVSNDMGGDAGYKDAKAEARAKRQPKRESLSKSVEALRYEDESARFFGGEPSTRDPNDSETDDKDAAKSAEKKKEDPTTQKMKGANSAAKYSRIKQFFKVYPHRR